MSKLTHIDLFAGPGGICTGFRAAGIETVMAVEYVDTCCETYSTNHPNVTVLHEDIRNVSNQQIKQFLKKNAMRNVDIVSAGFPCETFSTAGSKSRVYDDHRNFLYKEAIRIADAANARILLLENVPAFMTKKVDRLSEVRVIDLLISDLKKLGFRYHDFDVLNAKNYGVPQNRQRFILIASKEIPISKEFFNSEGSMRTSVSEALSDLPLIGPDTESNSYKSRPRNEYQRMLRSPVFWNKHDYKDVNESLTYHISPKHRAGTLQRFSLIEQGEGLKDLFDRLTKREIKKFQSQRVLPNKWYIQRNYRLIPTAVSRTVTSHCLDELVHPTLDRALSVREVARLQGFPDWYDFKGGPILCPHMYHTQDKYEQIGDAVPPLMAKHLGECITNLLYDGKRAISSRGSSGQISGEIRRSSFSVAA